MVSTHSQTVHDLWSLASAGDRYELIEGELVEVSPTSFEHGEIQLGLGAKLREFVIRHGLGSVVIESGFVLSRGPDTVLGPDIAFVSTERLPSDTTRFSAIPPDLAVEIVSPTDRPALIDRKVRHYLDAGVRIVWIVYPDRSEVRVHTANHPVRSVSGDDTLDGGDILPGMTLSMDDIFGETT